MFDLSSFSSSLRCMYSSRRAPPHEVPTLHPDFPSEDKSPDGRSFPSPLSAYPGQSDRTTSSPPPADFLSSSSPPTAASSTVHCTTAEQTGQAERAAALTEQEKLEGGEDKTCSSSPRGVWGRSSSSRSSTSNSTKTKGESQRRNQRRPNQALFSTKNSPKKSTFSLRTRLSRRGVSGGSKAAGVSSQEEAGQGDERESALSTRGKGGGRGGGRLLFAKGRAATVGGQPDRSRGRGLTMVRVRKPFSSRGPTFPEDEKTPYTAKRRSWQLFSANSVSGDDPDNLFPEKGGGRGKRRFFSSFPRRSRGSAQEELDGTDSQGIFGRMRRRRAGSSGGQVMLTSSTLASSGQHHSVPLDTDLEHLVAYPPPPPSVPQSAPDSKSSPHRTQEDNKVTRAVPRKGGGGGGSSSGAPGTFPERQVTEETDVSEGLFAGREGCEESSKKHAPLISGTPRLPEPEDDKKKEARTFPRGRSFFSRFSSRRRRSASSTRRRKNEEMREGRAKSCSPGTRTGEPERQEEEKEGERRPRGLGEKKGLQERRGRGGGGGGWGGNLGSGSSRLRMPRRRSIGGAGREGKKEEKDLSDAGSTALGDDGNWPGARIWDEDEEEAEKTKKKDKEGADDGDAGHQGEEVVEQSAADRSGARSSPERERQEEKEEEKGREEGGVGGECLDLISGGAPTGGFTLLQPEPADPREVEKPREDTKEGGHKLRR